MPEPSETHLGEGALLGVGLACAEAVPLLKTKVRALLLGRPPWGRCTP